MLARYVVADLLRNPRRTLSTLAGVLLGVGLFCGVLFFVDGLSASMTQRAVAPLAIDMQQVVADRVGGSLTLSQELGPTGRVGSGGRVRVDLVVDNGGDVDANEVIVRSLPADGLEYVDGSAEVDGTPVVGVDGNPLAQGPARIGLNVGTVGPGGSRRISYGLRATTDVDLDDTTVTSSFSSRELVAPTPADQQAVVPLAELADRIAAVDGVEAASPLSLADLPPDSLSTASGTVSGPAKIFGFDEAYAARDTTIAMVRGALSTHGAVLSAEAAEHLGAAIDDTVSVRLPDGSALDLPVTGVADLSQARSLFSSRRGGDLETFVYTPSSLVVSATMFANEVQPAYERAAAGRGARLKSPPIREVDISVDRELLAADPATAVGQTERIATEVAGLAAEQDYLLDNISNTLTVATADAEVARRLFLFLGVPGGFLAAALAAYSGTVLADAQRREQATLRIRGASRRHLLRMLGLRTALLTAAGSVVGLALGYLAAATILGQQSLARASTAGLVRSGLLGAVGGFVATGLALYVTGRRSIDREIHEDRARLVTRAPLWRRARLDVVGVTVVVVGTVVAVRARAFEGTPGSVYFGRSAELNLALLVLPIAVWMSGSLLAARLLGAALTRTEPTSSPSVGRPLPSLYRFSIGRRPWSIGNGAIVVALIVALAASLATFTASYDRAKEQDSRFANGADIRVTPSPTTAAPLTVDDAAIFRTDGVGEVTPVIYGPSNVILRSDRTSDPANLAAIDPTDFASVSPVADDDFVDGDAGGAMAALKGDPTAILISEDMAGFLQAGVGDTLRVLLARSTDAQTEIDLRVEGLFRRLPGFPDGADALMSVTAHTTAVPSKPPDFFLLSTTADGAGGLERAVASLERGPARTQSLQIDTRATTLDRDQSSLAALNIAGLVDLDATFSLGMAVVAIAIFVFGLLLQRRREYVTLRAQGLEPRTIRLLLMAEAGTVAVAGIAAGLVVGAAMGSYFVAVLRPLFVLDPTHRLPVAGLLVPVVLVLIATVVSSTAASRLVSRLEPTELLRDE